MRKHISLGQKQDEVLKIVKSINTYVSGEKDYYKSKIAVRELQISELKHDLKTCKIILAVLLSAIAICFAYLACS